MLKILVHPISWEQYLVDVEIDLMNLTCLKMNTLFETKSVHLYPLWEEAYPRKTHSDDLCLNFDYKPTRIEERIGN